MHTVQYNLESKTPHKTFCQTLTRSLENNFALACIEMHQIGHSKDVMFVTNIVSSNSIMQTRALQFVLCDGVNEPRDAEALERIVENCASTMLLCQIQDTMDLDSCQASVMLHTAVRLLDSLDVYMRVAGVVRNCVICVNRVMCHPADGLHLTIDKIPADCWFTIRCYLSVSDVL